MRIPGQNQSEDCLYLNIWSPANATNLPVFFWIHGGSFVSGSGAQYPGEYLVSTAASQGNPIVYVSINYRLGVLGFLGEKNLSTVVNSTNNSNQTTYGNWGTLDTVFALEWVRSNIAFFGGNPDNITIGGESAGGALVMTHLVSDVVSNNSFSQAIIESGVFYPDVTYSAEVGQRVANTIEAALNCTSVDCLYNATVSSIIAAQAKLPLPYFSLLVTPFGPLIDGYVLNSSLTDALVSNNFKNKPVLLGTNANETAAFTCPIIKSGLVRLPNATNEDVNSFVLGYIARYIGSNLTNALQDVYNNDTNEYPLTFITQVSSDIVFHCPARYAASKFSENSTVYLYSFNYEYRIDDQCYGAAHGYELAFLFPSIVNYYNYTLSNNTAASSDLSERMVQYWTSFISTGSPNIVAITANTTTSANSTLPTSSTNTTLLTWPTYNSTLDNEIVFDVTDSIAVGEYANECNFWNQVEGL